MVIVPLPIRSVLFVDVLSRTNDEPPRRLYAPEVLSVPLPERFSAAAVLAPVIVGSFAFAQPTVTPPVVCVIARVILSDPPRTAIALKVLATLMFSVPDSLFVKVPVTR